MKDLEVSETGRYEIISASVNQTSWSSARLLASGRAPLQALGRNRRTTNAPWIFSAIGIGDSHMSMIPKPGPDGDFRAVDREHLWRLMENERKQVTS
jgi:hypothetical protein